jgi:hypothetical protein
MNHRLPFKDVYEEKASKDFGKVIVTLLMLTKT